MKRAVVVCLVLAAFETTRAQLPDVWQHWRYVAPIDLGASDPPRLVSVTVPATLTIKAAPGWHDVRVIDDQGGEVPFLLHARMGTRSREWREARLLDQGVVPGQYSQAVLDLGADPEVHNAVHLTLSGDDDVQAMVEVAASDDRREWRVVEPAAPVYRLTRAGRGERTDVSYADSRARYLRLRIPDAPVPVAIATARAAHEIVEPAERVPAALTLSPAAPADGTTDSIWQSAPAATTEPLSAARFEGGEGQFARAVLIEAGSADGVWRPVVSGGIRRVEQEGRTHEQLLIEFPETTAHRWRVTVSNGNDAPIAGLAPALYTTPRHLVFRQEEGRAYRVIYGNARANAPAYDLASIVERSAIDATTLGVIGPERVNGAFVDPAPWTERHRYLLWIAIACAVATLAVMAVRTLRSSALK